MNSVGAVTRRPSCTPTTADCNNGKTVSSYVVSAESPSSPHTYLTFVPNPKLGRTEYGELPERHGCSGYSHGDGQEQPCQPGRAEAFDSRKCSVRLHAPGASIGQDSSKARKHGSDDKRQQVQLIIIYWYMVQTRSECRRTRTTVALRSLAEEIGVTDYDNVSPTKNKIRGRRFLVKQKIGHYCCGSLSAMKAHERVLKPCGKVAHGNSRGSGEAVRRE